MNFRLIFALCAFSGPSLFAQNDTMQLTLASFKGSWINAHYLQILRSTFSPRNAMISKDSNPPYLEISERGMQWMWEFHSGDGGQVDNFTPGEQPGTFHFSFHGGPSMFVINLRDRHSLDWTPPTTLGLSNKSYSFRRINQDIRRFVASAVLEGKYRDSSGQVYVFSDSGTATWPTGSFDYFLDLSDHNSRLDRLFLDLHPDATGTIRTAYGFTRTRDRLAFYREQRSDGELTEFAKTPFLVLRKLR